MSEVKIDKEQEAIIANLVEQGLIEDPSCRVDFNGRPHIQVKFSYITSDGRLDENALQMADEVDMAFGVTNKPYVWFPIDACYDISNADEPVESVKVVNGFDIVLAQSKDDKVYAKGNTAGRNRPRYPDNIDERLQFNNFEGELSVPKGLSIDIHTNLVLGCVKGYVGSPGVVNTRGTIALEIRGGLEVHLVGESQVLKRFMVGSRFERKEIDTVTLEAGMSTPMHVYRPKAADSETDLEIIRLVSRMREPYLGMDEELRIW